MKSIAIFVLAILVASSIQSAPVRRTGMSSAQKAVLRKVLKAGIDLVRVCAKAELSSKFPAVLKKLGVNPDVVVDAIASLADKAVDAFVKRNRRTGIMDKIKGAANGLKDAVVSAGDAVKNAAKTAGAGIKAVAGPMKAAYSQIDKLTGGKLTEAIANLGCPALMKAIQAGIAAQFPGVVVPGCVVAWFTSKCKSMVTSALKRHRLLRRLASIRREVMAF
jgi:hypothetical protein